MNDIQQKRMAIRGLYGPGWAKKVDKMSDKQVLALYLKFKLEGKIK